MELYLCPFIFRYMKPNRRNVLRQIQEGLVYCRWLSLDVVAGACSSGYFAARYLAEPIPWAWWVVLPLSVWLLYTADHLLDAYRLKDRAHTDRHLFHHRYFRPVFLIGIFLALLTGCIALLSLPSSLLYFGISMCCTGVLHFALVAWVKERISIWLHKEIGVALIYTLGVWGPFMLSAYPAWENIHLLGFVQFFLLALINLLMFSAFEIDIDTQDGHSSWARALGPKRVGIAINILATIFLALAVCSLLVPNSGFIHLLGQLGLCSVLLIHLLILRRRAYFSMNERYRIWGDAAFVLPGLFALIANLLH